jgi:hypothetical protein
MSLRERTRPGLGIIERNSSSSTPTQALPQKPIIPAEGDTVVRALLAFLIGAVVLGGCAAKQRAGSAQAVSAQEDKDRAACVEQSLNNKQTSNENQNSFASCMRAKGYNESKPSGTTANAAKPISDSISSESSSGLSASENYERAVANYNDCVLDHTGNLGACDKQRAIMNRLGKISSRSSLSQSYTLGNTQITQTKNNSGITQGANTASTPQAPSSQMPSPPSLEPSTTSSLPEQIPSPPGDRPTPF